MSEGFPTAEQDPKAEAAAAVASALHEDWRKTRKQEDGTFEPRVKGTRDEAWIATHGTDQVDIANTTYADLPADWQAENKAAAEVVVGILDGANGAVDLSDPAQHASVGATIHDAWLSRNEWARGGELDVPFDQLPPAEQAKDIDQMVIAQQALTQPQ
jgi:hypothetical protein